MTLVCECGSHALEITSQSYGEKTAFEAYKCEDCGRTGSYTFGNGQDRMSGCLTTDY
jgi:hypothetical protein